MSEHITHIAVYEDAVRVIRHTKKNFPPAFHEALDEAYDSGLLCCGARGNHLYAIPILEKARDLYGKPEYTPELREQLAGALGWLLHRAADIQMKPIFRQIDGLENPILFQDECQMYHDAVSYQEVYQGGKVSTETPLELVDTSVLSHRMEKNPASKKLNIDSFENLMAHYYVAEIANTCLFTSSLDDVDEYANKIVEYSQDLYEDLRMYIRAYENPEPFKHHGYITSWNIYDPNDELILFVRYVQKHGKAHPDIDVDEALATADNQCNYARALKRGLDYITGMSDFFNRKISRDELVRICEIWKPVTEFI